MNNLNEQESNLDLSNATVLIVDDTPANIQILSEALSDYKRKIAINGSIAIKLAEATPQPDIILLDIMMPEIDGFEVCKKLKENPDTKDIPVIFITAKKSVEDETTGLKLGAVDFLAKPISPPVVKARVKNHLELRFAQQKLEENNFLLQEQNQYITDSIRYAKHIQKSILKTDIELKKIFPNSFLIFQPKDIVSGDFYWFTQIENKKIIAVVDCTGHGVPGAFMSIIGNSKLNEIILEKGITNSADILNHLNQSIIDELHKELNPNSFDGMDLALCVIDERKKTVSFSGAYRPLLYWDKNGFKVLKGNRKSIGEFKKRKEFTCTTFNYTESGCLFMFSDGMPDQNNIKNKKFGIETIKKILSDNSESHLELKHDKLFEAFEHFKGTEVQRDDITFIGIEI